MKENFEDEWKPYLATGSDGKTIKNPALKRGLNIKLRSAKKGVDDGPWRTWTGQEIKSETRGGLTDLEIKDRYERLSKG